MNLIFSVVSSVFKAEAEARAKGMIGDLAYSSLPTEATEALSQPVNAKDFDDLIAA